MNVDIDYLDSANWDEEMPARLRWLRENDAVFRSEPTGAWVLSRYREVVDASKNQALFTSEYGVRANSPVKIGLIDEPAARHTQLRKLLNRGFTPRMVKRWEEIFQGLCHEVLDRVAPLGECDFVEEVAVPLPLLLIAEMIGIRKQDRERFHRWSDAMIAGDGNFGRPEIMAAAGKAYVEYSTYVNQIIEERRREPRDDFVSVLVHAKDEGLLRTYDEDSEAHRHAFGEDESFLHLANDELIKLLVILLVAGNETTRNAISGGMQLLIEHPDVGERLAAQPERIPVAVEEMLRLVSPVHSFSRTVTRDTELLGRQLREGDKVLLVYPSANRDAEVFPEPDRFDIERRPQHVAFGIGSHYCLGANLARMEMRFAFEQILRRLRGVQYAAGGPVMRPSALVRSCVEMRIRYATERLAA